jgi:hypothetical protein
VWLRITPTCHTETSGLFFFIETGGGNSPTHYIYSNQKEVYVQKKRTMKKSKRHQDKFCCYDFISGTILFFALWITKTYSFLNMSLQCSTDESSLLKSHLFLSFHMNQHMIIIIFIAKGTPIALQMCMVALSRLSQMLVLKHQSAFGLLDG